MSPRDLTRDETPAATAAGTPAAAGAERRICVLINPGSGKKKGREKHEALRAALGAHPERFTLRQVKGRDLTGAAQEAVTEGFDVVVAAGGDGSINAVAQALAGTGTALGVVPMGTFNFFARSLGIPEDPEQAVACLLEGQPRPVPIGEVNGTVFLNNASLGIYPAVLQQREGTYKRWGRSRIAAHWSVFVTFLKFHRPLSLRVTVDGHSRRVTTPLAFVATNPFQLDHFGLPGADCLREGQFALFLAPGGGRWRMLRNALRLAWGRMEEGRDFELACCRELIVEAKRRRLVAYDGERRRMNSPFRFEMRPEALKVICPAKEAAQAEDPAG